MLIHTHAHTQTGTRTNTHISTHSINLFSRTLCTSREYGEHGYIKIKEMAMSRLQIDRIENPTGFSTVRFRLQNLELRHSDDVFHVFQIPFANRIISSRFLRNRILEKKCWQTAYSRILRVVHKSCIFCFNLIFFVSLGCLVLEI